MDKDFIKDLDLTKTNAQILNILFTKALERAPSVTEMQLHERSVKDIKIKIHDFLQCRELSDKIKNKLTVQTHENKRFALQISGHLRHLKPEKWRKFISENKNVDIFIHTWTGSGARSSGKWINDSDNCDINVTDIINLFKPKKILLENAAEYLDNFSLYNQDKSLEVYYNEWQPMNPNIANIDFSRYIVSQLYSVYTANELRIEYENLMKVKYDLVFRVRGDTFPNIDFSKLTHLSNPDNVLYINSDSHIHFPYLGRGCAACLYEYPVKKHVDHANLICDIFYYGSPKIINKVSSIYLHVIDLVKKMAVHNKKQQVKYQSYNYLSKHQYNGYIVKHIAEDPIYKCLYPERLIVEYMKDEFLLTDPNRIYVEFK